MNYGKIGIRYAKALYIAAVEENALEQVYSDLHLLEELIAENPSFQFFLNTPVLKPSEKQNFFQSVFSTYLHSLTLRFFNLLTQNRRENRLVDIIRNFQMLFLLHHNTMSATLITTINVGTEMIEKIKQKLQVVLQKTILLQNKIDKNIVGGFILQIEDKEYDASAKTQLKKIKNTLVKTSMIK